METISLNSFKLESIFIRFVFGGLGAEGLALKGFRERKKMLRVHPVWSEQDKHVAENIPSTQKRKRQTVKHN